MTLSAGLIGGIADETLYQTDFGGPLTVETLAMFFAEGVTYPVPRDASLRDRQERARRVRHRYEVYVTELYLRIGLGPKLLGAGGA